MPRERWASRERKGGHPGPSQTQMSPGKLGARKATASPKETLPQALKLQALSGFLRSNTFFSPPAFEGKKSTLPH